MVAAYLSVLKQRNFGLLWFGQIISQFGDRLTQMALIGLVYKLEPGSTVSLAKMLSLAIIPVFLISPVAGVYVDRWNKKHTMYISDFLRGVIILLIPFTLIKLQSLIVIYILIFLSFCSGRFFIPAKMAIIPNLVSPKKIFLANSLISTTAMIAAVLGFGLGGVIVEKWGVATAFILDGTTFIISGIFIVCMRLKKEPSHFEAKDFVAMGKDAIINVKNSVAVEIKQGVSYILTSKETRYAAKIFFILFAFIGSLYTVFIVFVQQALSTGTLDLGWLAVAAGGGLFVGSLLYGRIAGYFSAHKIVNISLLAAALFLAGFVTFLKFHPYKLFALISCLILGLLASPIVIAVNSLIHTKSNNELWGRIFSSLEVVIHIGFLLFMFIASYLAEIMTPFTIIISVSIMVCFIAIIQIIYDHGTRKRVQKPST